MQYPSFLWSFNQNLLLTCVQELRFLTLLQNILDLFTNNIFLSFCLRFIFRSTDFETGRRPVSFPLDNEYSNVVFGLTTHPTNLKGVIFCVPYPNLLSSTFKKSGNSNDFSTISLDSIFLQGSYYLFQIPRNLKFNIIWDHIMVAQMAAPVFTDHTIMSLNPCF